MFSNGRALCKMEKNPCPFNMFKDAILINMASVQMKVINKANVFALVFNASR